ncbi:MAG TPA: pitrilysin family protein [Methylomirabilota bacterium]|nr:pitrilysin family protein [Methylomirabilota bacterium]
MTRTALAAIMAAALGASSVATPAEATWIRQRLDSGLVVLVQENPATPAVAVSVLVRVGSRWEREDNAGITNLLQQVLVKGTTSRTAFDVAEAAEAMGGSLSASGDTDYAEIRGTALARHWKSLLALMADVALHPALPPAEIDNERRVIASGIKNRLDQPFPLTYDTLMDRLFRSHPYGAPSLGRGAAVERLDRQTLVEHYDRYYRAGRIIVAISGQVPARQAVDEVARLFANAPRERETGDAPLGAPSASPDRLVINRPAAQAQIMLGFLAPPIGHPDYAAVKVLQVALGGGMAGRLFSELRDKQGLAYSTGALYPARVEPGFFLAFIGTAPASAGKAEDGMRAQVERIRGERVSEGELDRAKAYLLGQFALDRRTNARLAWYAAFYEAAGVGHDFADRYVRAIEAVSADDVLRVAKTYLASPTVVRLEPVPR